MAELGETERAGLLYAFSQLEQRSDYMIVDTAAGIAANTLQFCDASQEVIVVVCNDPASVTDAYATIKVLNQRTGRNRFRVLVNQAVNHAEAYALFGKLTDVTYRWFKTLIAAIGRSVTLLDADLGLANIDVMLGLNPEHNLLDVLRWLHPD